ncbi:MAG: ATPase [Alphaproteobacteria bacterium]
MIDIEDFRRLPHAVSLLGMSGVGKTTLSKSLRAVGNWYHFSADYRIGTRYLSEPIVDNIKYKIMAMDDQFVARLLRSDSIFIGHNISVDNLDPVSTFLGMYGDPVLGGLRKADFLERQELYRQAEVWSMGDVPHFITKAWNIYACDCFVNDASGSLCEIADPDDPEDPVIQPLIENTLLLYIRADSRAEEALKERARSQPKPLFYNPVFIGPRLESEPDNGIGVDPIGFARPLFPDLLEFRKPRYGALAERFGVTVDAAELYGPNADRTPSPEAFIEAIYAAMQREVANNKYGVETVERYVAACETRAAVRQAGAN